MIQDSLFSSKAPAVSSSEVERLVIELRYRGWLTADIVGVALGWSDRKVRAVASESQGRIISGQKGYCLIEEATVEEANHFVSWMRSQARQMQQRAHEVEKAMHRRHVA